MLKAGWGVARVLHKEQLQSCFMCRSSYVWPLFHPASAHLIMQCGGSAVINVFSYKNVLMVVSGIEIHCRKLTRVNWDVNFLLGWLLRERSTGESQDGSLGWWEVQSQAIALCSHHLISLSCVGQPTKIQWQLYEIPCSLKVVSSNKKADTRMGGKLANEKFSFCFYNLWILFNPLS